MCTSTNQQQQHQQHEGLQQRNDEIHVNEEPRPAPTVAVTVTASIAEPVTPQQEQEQRKRKARRRQQLYPQILQDEEKGDVDVDVDSYAGSEAASAAEGSYYVPPPAFVVVGTESARIIEGKAAKHKATDHLSASTVSEASSATSSSSSSSRDDRIRAKWIEMRAKDRKAKAVSASLSSLERMVGTTGSPSTSHYGFRGSVPSRFPRGSAADDDDSCRMIMMAFDDASDATLKVDNCNSNSMTVGTTAAVAAATAFPHPQYLYSTPIFTATLVESSDNDHADDDDMDDVHDPLEIMERAKAVARQELLREAVEATVVIPIGSSIDDNDLHDINLKDKDFDATSRSSSSSTGSSDDKARSSQSKKKKWVRIAVIVSILAIFWAGVAYAIAYFVSPKSGSSSSSPPPAGSSITGSTNSWNSTSSSSSSTASTIVAPYGAASYEAMGLSSDGSVLAIGILNASNMGAGGMVNVLRRTNSTNWAGQGFITDDGLPYFGLAVGVSGSGQRVVVGAPGGIEIGDPSVTVTGSVRVYDYDATMDMWESPYADFHGPSQGALFGHSVAVSGDASTIVAGAPSADAFGMAQVWTFNNATRQWEQRGQDLYSEVLDSHFGESTALSNDGQVLVVGGCGANAMGFSGTVSPYRFNATTDMWVPLGPPLVANATMERFGWDVAVSGDGRVMAACANVFSSQLPGSVHVYRYNDVAEEWEPFGDALVGQVNERFGYTISLSHDGTTIAIGAPGEKGIAAGAAHVYSFDKFTHSWSPMLSPDVGSGASTTDNLGEAVALSSDGSYVAASSSTAGYTKVFQLN